MDLREVVDAIVRVKVRVGNCVTMLGITDRIKVGGIKGDIAEVTGAARGLLPIK